VPAICCFAAQSIGEYMTRLELEESEPVILSEIILDNEHDVWSRVEHDHRKVCAREAGVVS